MTAVSLTRQAGGWIVGAHGTERLAPGVVTPALNAVNVHDARALAAAIRSAFDKLGARPRRVALVIPDTRREALAAALREGSRRRRISIS